MTTTWDRGETPESPFAPIDSVRLPFAREEPAPGPQGRLRFRTRRVAAAEVTVGGALVSPTAIAREKYGSAVWTTLVTTANPGVDFTRMRPGTKLRVPAAVVPEEAVTPSDLVGGTPVTMGDPLRVPFGQFTFDAEGNDVPGNAYYSRTPHWPGGGSGVTVGRGFDLGQHSREEVVAALTRAGVSSEYIAKLSGAAKVTGTKAGEFTTRFNREHKTFELSREQQWTLFVWEYMAQANTAARKLAACEIARPPATAMDIASLDVTTIELVIDLQFRGDLSQQVWELLRPAVNNRPALAALMQTRSNWPKVPVERYRARCAFLGVPAEQEIGRELEFEPSFEQPVPGAHITAAVGQGQTNSPDDVGIVGSAGHRLIPAPLPADPSGMGPTREQLLAPSEEDVAGESPGGCCSTCARQRQEAAGAFEQFGSPGARPYAIADQAEGPGMTTTWSLDETFESPFSAADPVRLPLAHEGPWQAADEVGSTDLWVPRAERIANPRSGGGSYLDSPWRFVFHTVEGEPSAAGFRRLAAEHANPPHLWAMPSADLLLQTVPLNRSAYALARPGSVQTNRLRAIQVEMWGFAAKMGQMDQRTIEWLADRLLGPVAKLVPINLDHVRPSGGVSCYGRNSGCRMTPEQWQIFDGVCGHQHVPDNEHWDPGDAPLRAIAARARGSAGSYVPQREQLGDHDGPGFAAERDEDESWTGGFEQLTPPDPATPPPPGFAPPPPDPPLAKAIPIVRDCCLLDVKSLKDTTTMGRYATPGGPASGVPGTVYTAKAGFVDLGHLLTFADVTAFAYQQIYAKKGAAGTTVTTAYGSARLTAAVADNLWLEQARKIAYDDSVAYEIETTKGAVSFVPGHLNSAFSPEDLCSNYLGTVVTAKALYSPTTKAGYKLSWANRVDGVLSELLQFLGVQSVVEAGKAFVLKNNIWIAWTNEASGASPYYLKRRNFTNKPWLAGHPSDQPGWAPTPFLPTPAYTYTHRSGFTRDHFEREINTFRAWALATFGPDYDKP